MDPVVLDLVCEAIAGGLCETDRDLRELLRALERLTASEPRAVPVVKPRTPKAGVVLGGFPQFRK